MVCVCVHVCIWFKYVLKCGREIVECIGYCGWQPAEVTSRILISATCMIGQLAWYMIDVHTTCKHDVISPLGLTYGLVVDPQ